MKNIATQRLGILFAFLSELLRERNKYQQGDAFTLKIQRDGREMTINAKFKACTEAEIQEAREQQEARKVRTEMLTERMYKMQFQMGEGFARKELQNIGKQERPILGIFEAEDEAERSGLVIGTVISGKGAEAAGLQPGDVITAVDGATITGTGALRAVLADHKAGDRVPVTYQRNGKTLQTEVALSTDRNSFSYTTQRNPFAVFIGVYTSDWAADGRGVKVTGIVDDTPAKQSGVQVGDIILAFDGQPVNTQPELLRERDKHQPGERFRLTILRDGAHLTIDATFKPCKTDETLEPVNEVVELASEEKAQQRETPKPSELQLQSLNLFPNPTAGPLNIRFEAEAVPTTVRIMDVTGKVVYTKTMNQFTGYFNEPVELFGNQPGNYLLTIQQGEQVISRKVILLSRA